MAKPLRHPILSYFVAVMAAVYGFAKLNGAQFTILDSQLDRPLRDVSGFWLVWYFFGYSKIYGSLIALIQIAAGLALTFPETQLVASMILVPVFVNIVLIDIFFAVGPEGLLPAVALLVAILVIAGSYRESLRAFFFPNGFTLMRKPIPIFRLAASVLIVAGAAQYTWWVANYNNRDPTALDGAWKVEKLEGAIDPLPATLFFEHNRAYMCVIKTTQSKYVTHHFEVTPKTIRIWEKWLKKETLLFQGEYALSSRELVLRGTWSGKPVTLQLRQDLSGL